MGKNIMVITLSIFLLIVLVAVWQLGVKDWAAGLSVSVLIIGLAGVIIWEISWRPKRDPVKRFFLRLLGRQQE